jgi:hypothetical protein
VYGARVSVLWHSLTNVSTAGTPWCEDGKSIKWNRAERANDEGWGERYFGSCGKRPEYFESMPDAFEYRDLYKPDLPN